MNTLLTNVHLISPDLNRKNQSILIENGKISAILPEGAELPKADSTFDAKGQMAVPGFLDVHIHGGMGYESTCGKPGAISAIAGGKLREGVTSWCPTTLTLGQDTLCESLQQIEDYRRNPTASKVIGTHLEGPYINPECIGAQNPAYVRKPNIDEVLQLNAISPVTIVSFAPEMENALPFTKALLDNGITPSAGHTNATMAQFTEAYKCGLRRLTHFCNQMTKLHHREIGLVGAGLFYDDVTCEMICDKIHLAPDMIRLAFKIKPIDKILLISDAMEASGLADGDYQIGGLAVVVKEGAARLKSTNALAGSTLKINVALKNIVEVTGLPIEQCIKATSWNQARNLGLQGLGKLEPGFTADITILDDDFNVKAVFIDGQQKL